MSAAPVFSVCFYEAPKREEEDETFDVPVLVLEWTDPSAFDW